jgi:hypothetical protein
MQKWAAAGPVEGAIVHAWMDSSWFTNQFQVTGFDATAGNLSFEDPQMPGYPLGGWQGGHNWIPGKDDAPGGDSTVAPLIIENLLAELDTPGEYYFDKVQRKLYLYPNSTSGTAAVSPPKLLVATRLQTLISARGSLAEPVRDITIRDIGIRDGASTFMVRHSVPRS